MKGTKFTYTLSIIEIIGLISMIFVHNNIIRIAIFVFLMPISLINAQIKRQMHAENKKPNKENKDDKNTRNLKKE